MKNHSACSRTGVALCFLGAAALAHAQLEFDDLSLSKNRLRVSARFGFDVQADIHNLVPAASTGTYDDGYVLPDISGGAGGKTWNWGYTQASQVVGDTLQYHRLESSPRDGTTDALSQTPTPGFEILYGRELKRFSLGEKHSLVLGAEAGFGAMDMNLRGGSTMKGTVQQTTDIYSLGGITPPLAPYSGTYNGPGPLLNSTPLSSTSTDMTGVTSSITEKVRSLVYGFKLGPYVEVPVYKRFSVDLGAGLAAVIADTELSYTETITAQAGFNPTLARTYQVNHSDFLVGFYGTADLSYEVANDFRVFVGGQYQHLGNATATGGDKTATLKLGGTVEAVVGVEVGF